MVGLVLRMALSLARAADAPDACVEALLAGAREDAQRTPVGASEVTAGLEVGARLLTYAGQPIAFALPHARAAARGRALRDALGEVVALHAGGRAGVWAGPDLTVEEAERRVAAGAACSTDRHDWYRVAVPIQEPLDGGTANVRVPVTAVATRGGLDEVGATEVLREHLDAFDGCGALGEGRGDWVADVRVGADGRVREVRARTNGVPDAVAACLSDAATALRFASSGRLTFTVRVDAAIAGR